MIQRTNNPGDTRRDVLEYYRTYLARNRDLETHCKQFMKREKSDLKAAEAEAVIFSWLRVESLNPRLYEDTGTGGPDFVCSQNGTEFLVEVTSLDSDSIADHSGLPAQITESGHGAFGLITDRLFGKAKAKVPQLAGHGLPTVLAITSDHAFAGILLDRMAADYLMTSAPQVNVPIGGGPEHMSTDLKHAAFHRATGVLDASGTPIIVPSRQSICAILLTAISENDMRTVGLIHPDAVHTFDPSLLPMIPFVRFVEPVTANHIQTEWVRVNGSVSESVFPHRRIRYPLQLHAASDGIYARLRGIFVHLLHTSATYTQRR